ncbi:KUP/HAK/KT family potassium transporter [Clostridium perfringens]|uniref:KUP/HAK/KT family potassium transporter n=1 Tax=Clostridium perfringens TaxID=1502 RepID=UPI00224566DC|nr:KUP/HAK/KT family potassium transporter [Clostridium perfringens]MCX0374364.1 KUP/HAK/KT family potassium transporter [Clostridium perfringens]
MSTNKSFIEKITLGSFLIALGVVYGDIGTSPLYVMKSIINGNGGLESITPDFILGVLSLIFWTMTLLTTIKYVLITLKADNKGEGGIFSLYTLVRRRAKWLIIPAMVGGSALLADGMLTPAVTVTSSIEGLKILPSFNTIFGNNQDIIIIIVLVILSFLFFIQHFGTEIIGKIFGPVMFIWFAFLAILGIVNLSGNLYLLKALSPHYAIKILFSPNNHLGFFILGGVFLSTTGAEALYSDLGHVGRKNIYLTWPLVKICLLLNYFGQAAWILSQKNNTKLYGIESLNPFFQMMPSWLLLFGVLISTLAAIIASQALISGSYTLVSEAIKLNLFPRLQCLYPSNSKGQIYMPAINRILWIACITIVLYFRSSDNMEAAYGLSITVTMLMTSILLFNYLLKRKTPLPIALIILVFFSSLEFSFLISSAVKFEKGGFVSVLIALCILSIMYIWIKGHYIKMSLLDYIPIENYKNQLKELKNDVDRPKYATNLVYLTSSEKSKRIERKIMYSILDKRPKRADVYWFVNVIVTDEPYTAEYTVNTFGTDYMVKVQLKLGFRVNQKLNVFLRQIVCELINNGDIKVQNRKYTTLPNRNVGDFRFILINECLSSESKLESWNSMIIRSKLFIKKFTVSPAKWFGLESSEIEVENVPLILGSTEHTTLKRVYK